MTILRIIQAGLISIGLVLGTSTAAHADSGLGGVGSLVGGLVSTVTGLLGTVLGIVTGLVGGLLGSILG